MATSVPCVSSSCRRPGRNALPALINHTVSLFKNSSLAMAIGVAELTYAAREMRTKTPHIQTYLIATLLYLTSSLLLMALGAWLNRRAQPAGAH